MRSQIAFKLDYRQVAFLKGTEPLLFIADEFAIQSPILVGLSLYDLALQVQQACTARTENVQVNGKSVATPRSFIGDARKELLDKYIGIQINGFLVAGAAVLKVPNEEREVRPRKSLQRKLLHV
jgi:hypothetical protein